LQSNGSKKDAEVSSLFSKYYMQRVTIEFAEDLDRIRGADDFRDNALPLLVNALQQGISVFSIEDQKRVVLAGKDDEMVRK
jgi:ribosome assembly protein 3